MLRTVSPADRADEIIGDLEEAHQGRMSRHGPFMADLLTALEALDMARALVLHRLRVPRVSLLDFKLGLRMLFRYPGLTLIALPAIAFAVVASVWVFEYIERVAGPALPFDEGDRIVGVLHRDVETSRNQLPRLHDFVDWSNDLSSVQELGAFREIKSNLTVGTGRPAPVTVAEITSEALKIARTPALLGRTLNIADEQIDAPMVLVIGYDAWQAHFDGDPSVIGSTVRLGTAVHTVVGVMPDGFAYPVANDYWRPLRLNTLHYERGQAPTLRVVGRLSQGVRLQDAQSELRTLGERAAVDYPDTHGALRTTLDLYTRTIIRLESEERFAMRLANLALLLLMVLVCGNVALLMFARAASREGEIVIRSALGASRGRIVMQLIAEAVVLGGVGAVVGVVVASKLMMWALTQVQDELMGGFVFPFWFSEGIGLPTLLYAGGIALFGSVLMGVLPALKMTGPRVEATLKQAAAGSNLAFGGVWTAIIVTQIAVTVTLPVMTYLMSLEMSRLEGAAVPFPAKEFLVAQLVLDEEVPIQGASPETPEEYRLRFARTYEELKDRLTAEPNVVGMTFANRLPLQTHEPRRVQLDEVGANAQVTGLGHRISSANVATDFLETLGQSPVAGRSFGSADLQAEQRSVLVNQSFVDLILGGRNPIGRRIRYFPQSSRWTTAEDEESATWYEIVGVVPDMGMAIPPDTRTAGVYHPSGLGESYPVRIAIHVTGDLDSFIPVLRQIAATLDPLLTLNDVMSMDEGTSSDIRLWTFFSRVSVFGGGLGLLLSLAGIFSAMSFVVSRKTREIGIRVALGSTRRRIIAKIFKRPAIQVAFGLLGGIVLSEALASLVVEGGVGPIVALTVLLCSTSMACVCMLACVIPVRRALAIEPAEALRWE